MKKVLSLILLVVMAAAIVACGGENEPQQAPSNGEEQKPPQQEIFAVGDRVKIGDFFITVKKAYFYAGSQWNKPSEDENWVVVDVELENASDETVHVSSLLMFALYDEENYEADMVINTDAKGSLDGELGAGRKMAGELTFSVPKDQSTFEFIFKPDLFKTGQAIFLLEVK
ncbi:MAG: DUF4352 domain-containing protein [Firmicutes bacterium]|nr:DUF4352 domain-containing protein [Bacillota bacterium]HOB35769.1 DUF4352 domain-containing protein [Bacillota bacterium]HPZ90419.1 DUF4352 domain-containing protein [Bacillota bacterium]HQE02517.1 DUF4352 domain-containing protein [Bacillota bacterium]